MWNESSGVLQEISDNFNSHVSLSSSHMMQTVIPDNASDGTGSHDSLATAEVAQWARECLLDAAPEDGDDVDELMMWDSLDGPEDKPAQLSLREFEPSHVINTRSRSSTKSSGGAADNNGKVRKVNGNGSDYESAGEGSETDDDHTIDGDDSHTSDSDFLDSRTRVPIKANFDDNSQHRIREQHDQLARTLDSLSKRIEQDSKLNHSQLLELTQSFQNIQLEQSLIHQQQIDLRNAVQQFQAQVSKLSSLNDTIQQNLDKTFESFREESASSSQQMISDLLLSLTTDITAQMREQHSSTELQLLELNQRMQQHADQLQQQERDLNRTTSKLTDSTHSILESLFELRSLIDNFADRLDQHDKEFQSIKVHITQFHKKHDESEAALVRALELSKESTTNLLHQQQASIEAMVNKRVEERMEKHEMQNDIMERRFMEMMRQVSELSTWRLQTEHHQQSQQQSALSLSAQAMQAMQQTMQIQVQQMVQEHVALNVQRLQQQMEEALLSHQIANCAPPKKVEYSDESNQSAHLPRLSFSDKSNASNDADVISPLPAVAADGPSRNPPSEEKLFPPFHILATSASALSEITSDNAQVPRAEEVVEFVNPNSKVFDAVVDAPSQHQPKTLYLMPNFHNSIAVEPAVVDSKPELPFSSSLQSFDVAVAVESVTAAIEKSKQLVASKMHREYAVTSGADANIHIWETATGRVLTTLNGHVSHVTGLSFSNCGRYFVSGGGDKKV
jgi:myosin heavy subunit